MKQVSFHEKLVQHNLHIQRQSIEVLQLNLGKKCNLACHHCHVDAGPNRTELMAPDTVDRILHLIDKQPEIHTVDLTGGAPELNPEFRHLVSALRARRKHIIDRCNLAILQEPDQSTLTGFLAENTVHIVASLPCYSENNVDMQRGRGTFQSSIEALHALNGAGYGINSELQLDLVYNPVGATLPPDQVQLEKRYKEKLLEDFGIHFNRLLTITNMPINRFLHALQRDGKDQEYWQLLIENFNPKTIGQLMCKNQLSIAWDGEIFDCDFNQMLQLGCHATKTNVHDIEHFQELCELKIRTANHCYACTAGSGSSCGGSLD
ncbi:MAG: arsenosugar biosynthesis radical SAM protein ArsS [Pseudomonadales bacterium]|nr:arsenosugar biosynthesis radical SAM protein ArsS [Pseudomonadales bacterium]